MLRASDRLVSTTFNSSQINGIYRLYIKEVTYIGNPCDQDGEPCEVCTGDCDNDSDCVGSLRCGQRRTTTGLEIVPGCVWGPGSDEIRLENDDYCK